MAWWQLATSSRRRWVRDRNVKFGDGVTSNVQEDEPINVCKTRTSGICVYSALHYQILRFCYPPIFAGCNYVVSFLFSSRTVTPEPPQKPPGNWVPKAMCDDGKAPENQVLYPWALCFYAPLLARPLHIGLEIVKSSGSGIRFGDRD